MADILGVVDNIGDRVHIVDTSNPILPFIAGELAGAGLPNYLDTPYDVAVQGNFVYVVSSNDDSLTVVNATVPATPTLAGVIRGGGAPNYLNNPRAIAVLGNYAYVVSQTDNALSIFNISDPNNPAFVGALVGFANLSSPRVLAVSGNYAYILCQDSDSLEVVDISDPTNPTVVGALVDARLDTPGGIFVLGNYVYTTSEQGGNYYLLVINISDPTTPVVIGVLQAAPGNFLADPRGIIVSGNYAYIASFNDDALTIIDISNPAIPVYSGSLSGFGAPNWLNSAMDVSLIGNYAYVCCMGGAPGGNSIVEIDVTNPALPVLVLALHGAAVGWVRGIGYWSVIAPTVQTNPATSVEQTSATPNGTLDDDGGEACDCGFEYGETINYGSTTATQSKTTGETFSQEVRGLRPGGITYHFRAVATNSEGTSYGDDQTFRTEALSAEAHQALGKAYALGKHGL